MGVRVEAGIPGHGQPVIAASNATTRWSVNLPLLIAGGVSIIAGGLIAAVTGPADWEHGAWVAACS